MGRTACTEPQCLYKGALYLYLTVELYLYPPPSMGRTACTEPQCLYNGALYPYPLDNTTVKNFYIEQSLDFVLRYKQAICYFDKYF